MQLRQIATATNVIKLTLAVGSSYLAYQTLCIYLKRRKYRHIPGPRTKGIFGYFFGNVDEIQRLMSEGKHFGDALVKWNLLYGDVFKFQFLDNMWVVTSSPEAIKEILITRNDPKVKEFTKMIAYPFNQRFLGHGLVTEMDSVKWRHRRLLFNQGFNKNEMMSYVIQFNIKADILMEHLRQYADGKSVVKMSKEMNHATLEAIMHIAFGMNVDSINQRDPQYSYAMKKILEMMNEWFTDPLVTVKPTNVTRINEFKKLLAFLRDRGRDRIRERMREVKAGERPVENDILSKILQICGQEELDLEEMVDEFMTFLLAGQETTAK